MLNISRQECLLVILSTIDNEFKISHSWILFFSYLAKKSKWYLLFHLCIIFVFKACKHKSFKDMIFC